MQKLLVQVQKKCVAKKKDKKITSRRLLLTSPGDLVLADNFVESEAEIPHLHLRGARNLSAMLPQSQTTRSIRTIRFAPPSDSRAIATRTSSAQLPSTSNVCSTCRLSTLKTSFPKQRCPAKPHSVASALMPHLHSTLMSPRRTMPKSMRIPTRLNAW